MTLEVSEVSLESSKQHGNNLSNHKGTVGSSQNRKMTRKQEISATCAKPEEFCCTSVAHEVPSPKFADMHETSLP
jgi:hypothetical protein